MGSCSPRGVRSREKMARRGRENAERLFSTYDSYSLQEHQREQMAAAIADADAEEIRTGDVEELAKQFSDQFSLEAPTLLEGALSITADEAQVDVTGDYRFGAFGPGYRSEEHTSELQSPMY